MPQFLSARILSALIGYAFGCILTAEIVARRFAGRPASELGETGNPGMANIMASIGFRPGILTLIGDLSKCAAAQILAFLLFRNAGRIVLLYAALGCTVGHDYPFWRRFRGGKGVATTCIGIGIYHFLPALAVVLTGLAVTVFTKYLCISGPVIPAAFALIELLCKNREAALIGAVLTALSLLRNRVSLGGIRSGKTSPTDVIGAIRKKIGRGGTPEH